MQRSPNAAGTVIERLNTLRAELRLYIQEQLPLLFSEIREETAYMILGGKLLRGAFSLFSSEVFGCDRVHALPIAMAVELMHSSSLVYDDISDLAETRRGILSFWKRYGLDEAVTIPHVTMAVAISLIAQHGGLAAVLASMNAWRRAAVGQIWDLRVKKGAKLPVSYREVISLKTGEIFGAACILPLFAVDEVSLVNILKNFGVYLGAAYQVIDDMSDLARGIKDSGSAVLLFKESQGLFLEHGAEVLRALLAGLRSMAASIPGEFWALALETLKAFAGEAEEEVRKRAFDVIREFEEAPRAPA